MKGDLLQHVSEIRPGSARRKSLSVTQQGLVTFDLHASGLPLIMQPTVEGLDLVTWALSNRSLLKTHLLKHGGILFRGFKISAAEVFEQFVVASATELLQYRERSSPRTQVSNNIYTSTDYPANQSIFLHNENSYQHTWPMKIFFFCEQPSTQGGETPIADCRKVLDRIDVKIRQRFENVGWMLVRNFGNGLSLSWQSVFQTQDKSAVETYCRQAGIESEWHGDLLRTRQVRQAIRRHPETGQPVWFNHAAFFHVTTLVPETRDGLLTGLEQSDLPNNTYYGDGSLIEFSVLEEIREAYRSETISFAWQAGDILMLDNMLVAHGRSPYVGPRKVLVAMAEPFNPHI